MNYSIIKKSIFLFVFFGCMLLSGKAFASTDVSGIISQDTVWDKAGSPYIVKGNILVDTGATLTIGEGVSVLFSADNYIQIRGKLLARGTNNNKISFSSNNDLKQGKVQLYSNENILEFFLITHLSYGICVYGDSNLIQNGLISDCYYDGIYASSSESNIFSECEISECGYYGGIHLNYYANNNTIMNCRVTKCTYGISLTSNVGRCSDNIIRNCILIDNQNEGIYLLNGSNTNISNCYIENNLNGIGSHNNGNSISYCTIDSNKENGIVIHPDDVIKNNNIYFNLVNIKSVYGINKQTDCTNNYWGTTDKTEISNNIYDFYDDFNLCKVIYEPYLLAPYGSNTDATAKEIKVNGNDINGFSSVTESYRVELPYGTTAIPEVTATANDTNAKILVTPATTLPGTTNVLVTAEDGETTKTYTIMFTIAKNNDATLSTLSLSQGALNPIFSPTTTSYTADVNYGVNARSITLTLNDSHASVTVNEIPVSLAIPICINLSEGTNDIIIEVTAEDGVTVNTYTISITELEQTVAEAVDQVNAATSVSLMQTAITNIRLGLILNGYNALSENDKSIALWSMLNGRPYTNKAAIQNALDTEVGLIGDQNAVNAIKAGLGIGYADGDSAEFVTQDLMITTNQDGVSISWASDNVAIAADGKVTRPKYSSGDVTVTLTATLSRGSSYDAKIFTVKVIKQAANTDATLKQININGIALSGFEATNKTYSYELPNGTAAIPEVTATANDSNAKIIITPATVLPGITEVKVTAEDGIAISIYTVSFTVAAPKNTDASLSDLKVDGTTIADFASTVLDYQIVLPTGTTAIPTVTAEVNDTGKANMVVIPATNLPGTTTVLVTAEDGVTTKTYTISFTVMQSITVTSNMPDVAVDNTPLQILVPSDVNNAALITNPTNGQVTLPQVDVQADTSFGTVKVAIPVGNQVKGPASWDGTIKLPQIREINSMIIPAEEGKTASVGAVIEIGFSDTVLTFSQPVRITLNGQGGKKAGWIQNNNFIPITYQMTTDSADALGNNHDGFITVGNDLVIWTKHFTIFVAYTEVAMEQTATPVITGTPTAAATSISGTATPGSSIVLSINGTAQPVVTADAVTGSWIITGLTLTSNDIISVTAQVAGQSVSTPATATVTQLDECFIATAAFGSKFEPAVVVLRHFRDQFLLTSKLGTALVDFYYHNSPPIAAYIAQSEPLKALVRIMLIPVIAATYSIMNPGVGIGGIILLVVILAARKSREKALKV